jgi:hypothetical protein
VQPINGEKLQDAMEVDREEAAAAAAAAKDGEGSVQIELKPEDEKSARAVATKVSTMVADQVSRSSPFTSEANLSSENKKHLLGKKSDSIAVSDISSGAEKAGGDAAGSGPASEDQSNGEHFDKELWIQRATEYVNGVLEKLRDSAGSDRSSSAVDADGVNLSEGQIDVIEFIEDRWKRVQGGSILAGPVASGKTIATCALLWRHRSCGPQLLVCSSAAMVC